MPRIQEPFDMPVSTARRSSARKPQFVAKPRGLLHPRVQEVGPERFALLCVDCAKSRSTWMLADFYGRVLWPATTVQHTRGEMEAALAAVEAVIHRHGIADAVAAVERTGNYHLPVQRTLCRAGWEVRIVHPFATRQFRQPANPGQKTDDLDLLAIHRTAVAGLGLVEPQWERPYRQLQLLTRHRRDRVQKASTLRCQIKEHLHTAMPGFAQLFDDLWDTPLAMTVARATGSANALLEMGEAALHELLKHHRIRYHHRTVHKLLAWARTAPTPHPDADVHQQIFDQLEEDRLALQQRIQALERQIAQLLVHMPYVLLLSVPGIHVVSAAELAGEMGPITHYANPNHITGRAGLFPSRYQSDQTDHADGPLVPQGNRRLRTAIMTIADNLVACNDYFGAKARLWQTQGKDPRQSRVKVAKSFTRIAFHMVAGGEVFHHPCCRERAYILNKLVGFAIEHQTSAEELLAGLRGAADQLPARQRQTEAEPLQHRVQRTRRSRATEPQRLGEILSRLLAELGLTVAVQSEQSRSQDPG